MGVRIRIPGLVWHFCAYFIALYAYYLVVLDPVLYANHHQLAFFLDPGPSRWRPSRWPAAG